MLRAGSAAVNLTPPIGSRMLGGWGIVATAIHDPLYARALVVEDARTTVAIVACDTLSLKRSTVRQARELVTAATGIPTDHILICATHTHNGPATAELFTCPADDAYLGLLPRHIAGTVHLACQALRPVEIGVGSGWEESASHNRRFLRNDGTAQTHPPKGDPAFVGPEGPADHEVGVLFARANDGRLAVSIVNYTSHPTLALGEKAFSADYPGQVCRALQAVMGHQGEVLFVNGAFGNVCPIDVYDLAHNERGWDWVERVGNVIAGEALRVMARADPVATASVRAANRDIELMLREITEDQLASARALLPDDDVSYREGMLPDEQTAFRDRFYARETLLVAEERRQSPTLLAEVQVIAIGEAAFVGVPGELFVEFGLEIKRRSPFRFTYVAGMANGCTGYIPTPRAFAHGGYETRLARLSKLAPDAGEQLTETAVGLLRDVYARA